MYIVSTLTIITLFIIVYSAFMIPSLMGTTAATVLSNSSYIVENLNKIDTGNQDRLIIYGASIIDGKNAQPRHNATIFINEGKIIDIINNNNDSISSKEYIKNNLNVTIIDATGKYIIPGLFDMHAHVAGVLKNSFNQTLAEESLTMLLNYGVTTIRNPGGPTEQSIDLREKISSGKINGPQILTAGRLLNSPQIPIPFVEMKVSTEEEVIEEVKRQANQRVDFIKLYVGLTPDLVKVAIDEAHKNGIKVIGHLYSTSWTEAANMDIDYLTHGVPVNPYLLSDEEEGIFQSNAGGPFNHFLWLNLFDINDKEINDMVDALIRNNVSVDPTLSIYEAMIDGHSDEQYLWSKILLLTKKMYDKGVKILAGTDIPNFKLLPGKSLHHELKLLVDAGIPSNNVITIATRNGAESLGILDETGTIEIGKQADMILLSSNPIENINNTKDIHLVISDGKIIDNLFSK